MNNQQYPFALEALPYDYNSLEPYIDTKTMHLHHNKHLRTYIDNLNNILKDYPKLQSFSLQKLIRNNRYLPMNIRNDIKNNAGGVYNHTLYFGLLSPNTSHKPVGKLKQALENEFHSYSQFEHKFKETALKQFGSAYTWLLVDKLGKLYITSTPNQDTALNTQLSPVLLVDLWEHSYYLKYNNRRSDYIDNWFSVLNWEQAEFNFLKATNTKTCTSTSI